MQQTDSATIPVKGDIDLRHVRSGVDLGVMFDVESRRDFSLWIIILLLTR